MRLFRLSLLASVLAIAGHASQGLALEPAQTIPLPGVQGRIDHLAIDLRGKRLFVAALGNNTVEEVDLAAGKRIRTITGIKEPQGVLFAPGNGTLYVGSGEGGSCEIYDPQSLKLLASIKLGEDADNVRYTPQSGRIYVGYGQGAIGVIDTETKTKVADIPLKAHPESFQVETKGNRIFVNVPKAMQIAVIDRTTNAVVSTWPVHQAHDNYPMALDEAHHRLFAGCRKPARLLVFDTENGKLITSSDCSADTDDVFYDAAAQRVYLACGDGFIDVFDAHDAKLTRLQHLTTAAGARTALFVPELNSLYLAVPQRGAQNAEIRVYKTQEH